MIRIGREIRCLPYAGFFLMFLLNGVPFLCEYPIFYRYRITNCKFRKLLAFLIIYLKV